ncbi:MAG: 4'-phosphopantetheinyl transferase superfamily protein [Bacteroidales bacterium]|jgi:4'-phosphopantetheinyl transferase|nr:4'-phosphopantetheinyl transferase superfamily protein [Bacteroidales bacterium]
MGLFYSRQLENGATISLWDITESEEELMKLCSVPKEELDELRLIKNSARRRERLAVRALLNVLFDGKVYLGHHDNGRPFLQNSLTEISISHTSRFVSILTHPEESVGIDIESLERSFSAVEKKALSNQEREALSERQRNTHLAIYWSAKEALFKRMSLTDVDFANQMFIKRFTPKESGDLYALFTDKEGEQQEFELSYEILENHVMAWIVG